MAVAPEAASPAVIRGAAQLLGVAVRRGDNAPVGPLTVFHAHVAPDICIESYFQRLCQFCRCSDAAVLHSLVYIERFLLKAGQPLCSQNAHRTVLVALLVAAKFCDDSYYKSSYWARVGGVALAELNKLECEFLWVVAFTLLVRHDHIAALQSRLLHSVAVEVPAEDGEDVCMELEEEADVGGDADVEEEEEEEDAYCEGEDAYFDNSEALMEVEDDHDPGADSGMDVEESEDSDSDAMYDDSGSSGCFDVPMKSSGHSVDADVDDGSAVWRSYDPVHRLSLEEDAMASPNLVAMAY